jgi:tetratricopeptide (TPR) repeat protein
MPRFHIIQFMSFTVIAAIIVVILGRPAEGLVLIPILLGLVIVSRIVLPFIPNSLEAVLRRPPEDLDRHIVALKRALANQSVIRFGPIAQARYTLMQLYMRQQRFGDGIAQGREFLARYRTPRSVKSRVHLDIAFGLDCLGREDEAKAEQRLARDWLDIPPVDAVGWLVQGKLFAARDRHDLAIDAYKRALQMPAALRQINLTDVRVLITTACLKIGRFEDAID